MNGTVDDSEIAARNLIRWSNLLAWPGAGILIFGVPAVSNAGGGRALTALVAVASIAMIVVGTMLGQRGKRRLKRLDNP